MNPVVFLLQLEYCLSNLSFSNLCILHATFFVTLVTSVVSYRLSPFHPLAKFPGPTMHKITKFWSAWICWTGYQHLVNKEMHDIYGPIVRTGPNEISIIDSSAMGTVLGAGGLVKGDYYKARRDPTTSPNLLVLQGNHHARRRQLWNRGMSTEALEGYQEIISKRAQQLVNRLSSQSRSTVDLVAWLNYFAFGGGFEMLQSGGDVDNFLWLMETFGRYVAVVCHIPWAFPAARKLPFISRHVLSLRAIGKDRALNRVQEGSKVKDLWYHLMDEAGLEKQKPTIGDIVADGSLAIIAGADTTSAALSSLFYFLLSDMKYYKRLQAEIDAAFAHGEDPLHFSRDRELPFLTACINETLRLQPPVPTNGPRQVLPGTGGKMISGRFIPEGTQVWMPPFARQRSPEYFHPSPDHFVPERWLRQDDAGSDLESDSDFIRHNLRAFAPFSFGPSNCVGKNLATCQILLTTCALMQRFEFSFAEDFDSHNWLSGIQDFFVTVRKPLLVDVKARSLK
ncbi:cytochrome P450 [Mycena floridula]|nr:cytochrome P450 [Mycena floridula]